MGIMGALASMIGAALGESLMDQIRVETLEDDQTLALKDGSLLTVVELAGELQGVGEEGREDQVKAARTALAPYLSAPGHMIEITFVRDPDAAREMVRRHVRHAGMAARSLGLDLQDLLEERAKAMAGQMTAESCLAGLYTRPSAMSPEEAKSARRRAGLLGSVPSMGRAQSPKAAAEGVYTRHLAFTEAFARTMRHAGQACRILSAERTLQEARAGLYPATAPLKEDWRPRFPRGWANSSPGSWRGFGDRGFVPQSPGERGFGDQSSSERNSGDQDPDRLDSGGQGVPGQDSAERGFGDQGSGELDSGRQGFDEKGSADRDSAGQSSGERDSGNQGPGGLDPGDKAFGGQGSARQDSGGRSCGEKSPANQSPAGQTPSEQRPERRNPPKQGPGWWSLGKRAAKKPAIAMMPETPAQMAGRDCGHLGIPGFDRQLATEAVFCGPDGVVRIGDRLFAAFDMTLAPETLTPFNSLVSDIGSRARSMAWRASMRIESGGLQAQRLKSMLLSIFAFAAPTANGRIREALSGLEELDGRADTVVRFRMSFATWAPLGEGKRLRQNLLTLQSAVRRWGNSGADGISGDHLATVLSTSPCLGAASTAPVAAALLEDVVAMAPLARQASPWQSGPALLHTEQGKPWPYLSGSSEQSTWLTLIAGGPGSGKSTLMNAMNLASVLAPGAAGDSGFGLDSAPPGGPPALGALEEPAHHGPGASGAPGAAETPAAARSWIAHGADGEWSGPGSSGLPDPRGESGESTEAAPAGISEGLDPLPRQGLSGQTGAAGSTGAVEAAGFPGSPGAIGPEGARGAAGGADHPGPSPRPDPLGAAGKPAETGPAGISEDLDPLSRQGLSGQAGAAGSTGAVEAAGAPGFPGSSGTIGPEGARGDAGGADHPNSAPRLDPPGQAGEPAENAPGNAHEASGGAKPGQTPQNQSQNSRALPRIAIIDIGGSSSGLVSLLREALPPRRRHEVEFQRLRMSGANAVNVFDTQLGMRKPLAAERQFLVNFTSLLCGGGAEGGESPMRGLVSAAIDQAYETLSDRKSPRRYVEGDCPEADAALEETRLGPGRCESWWDAVDHLAQAGRLHEAELAQRHAAPGLPDLVAASQSEQVAPLYEGIRDARTGEPLLSGLQRAASEVARDFPMLAAPSRFSIGMSRVASLDLSEVTSRDGGPGSQRRSAAMFMLARWLLTRDFFLDSGEIHAAARRGDLPAFCERHHLARARESLRAPKLICMDEFHRAGQSPEFCAQLLQDAREGRKFNVDIKVASQLPQDFPKAMLEMASGFIMCNSGSEASIRHLEESIGLSGADRRVIRSELTGPSPLGSPLWCMFRLKSRASVRQKLCLGLGPVELWAFSTTSEDVALRDALCARLGPRLARRALAVRFPGGSARPELESRLARLEDSPGDARSSHGVIAGLAEELVAQAWSAAWDSSPPGSL